MNIKTSTGMGLKTGTGMGIRTSNGMGLASENDYTKFDEYERTRRYLFGDRGYGKTPTRKKPAAKPALKKNTSSKNTSDASREIHAVTISKKKSVMFVTPVTDTSDLPALNGNSLGSVKRMLNMFG